MLVPAKHLHGFRHVARFRGFGLEVDQPGQFRMHPVLAEGLAHYQLQLGGTTETCCRRVAFGRDNPVLDRVEEARVGREGAVGLYKKAVSGYIMAARQRARGAVFWPLGSPPVKQTEAALCQPTAPARTQSRSSSAKLSNSVSPKYKRRVHFARSTKVLKGWGIQDYNLCKNSLHPSNLVNKRFPNHSQTGAFAFLTIII